MSDASGFSSTSFGLPSTPILPATGSLFAPSIGTPNIIFRIEDGLLVGTFGQVVARYNQTFVQETGMLPVSIGSIVAKYNQTGTQDAQELFAAKELFDVYLPALVPPAIEITSNFTSNGVYDPVGMYYTAYFSSNVLHSQFYNVDQFAQPGFSYVLEYEFSLPPGSGVAGYLDFNATINWENPLDATDFDQVYVVLSRATGSSDVNVDLGFYREVDGVTTYDDYDSFSDATIPQWNNGTTYFYARIVVDADTVSLYLIQDSTEYLIGSFSSPGFSMQAATNVSVYAVGCSVRYAAMSNTDDTVSIDNRDIAIRYGSHYGRNYNRARYVPPLIKFGTWTGYTPVAQLDSASGLNVQKFGTPVLLLGLPPSASICAATGVNPVQFGTPATPVSGSFAVRSITPTLDIGTPSVTPFTQIGAVSSIAVGRIGNHESGIIEVATGLNASLSVGTPTVVSLHTVSGSKFPIFPTPVSTEQHNATGGVRRLPRFGTPSSSLSNIHSVYGINGSPKFGRGSAYQRFNHPATSIQIGAVGNPDSFMSHKTLHIPPNTNFGTPLLRRTPIC